MEGSSDALGAASGRRSTGDELTDKRGSTAESAIGGQTYDTSNQTSVHCFCDARRCRLGRMHCVGSTRLVRDRDRARTRSRCRPLHGSARAAASSSSWSCASLQSARPPWLRLPPLALARFRSSAAPPLDPGRLPHGVADRRPQGRRRLHGQQEVHLPGRHRRVRARHRGRNRSDVRRHRNSASPLSRLSHSQQSAAAAAVACGWPPTSASHQAFRWLFFCFSSLFDSVVCGSSSSTSTIAPGFHDTALARQSRRCIALLLLLHWRAAQGEHRPRPLPPPRPLPLSPTRRSAASRSTNTHRLDSIRILVALP